MKPLGSDVAPGVVMNSKVVIARPSMGNCSMRSFSTTVASVGAVVVTSGTTFSVKLPTSLMISKGILLEAGSGEYVLPLAAIRDMVKISSQQVHQYRGSRIVQIRGEVYSVFSLAELFELRPKESAELSLAIVEAGRVRYGLMVDRFVSEVEVIVKPLSGGLEDCKEFQGAAIMGDGRVVLVLNPLECHRIERSVCA